jgi:hypothetical protein
MRNRVSASPIRIKRNLDSSGQNQILLFNAQGEVLSTRLPSHTSQKLIELLDPSPKAVARSSGGLSLVQLSPQWYLKKETKEPELLIKVIFNELERNSQHQIISKNLVTQAKVIPIQDILDGFRVEERGSQAYVVDFGMGIIPVYVFRFYRDADGFSWALFVRYDELEKALINPDSKPSSVTIYEVPTALLRIIHPLKTNGEKDFIWAKEHAGVLVERGETLIPEILLVQDSIVIPQGLSLEQIEQLLLDEIHPSEPKEFELLIPLDENPD